MRSTKFVAGFKFTKIQSITLKQTLKVAIDPLLAPNQQDSLFEYLKKAIEPMHPATLSLQANILTWLKDLKTVPDEAKNCLLQLKQNMQQNHEHFSGTIPQPWIQTDTPI